MSNPGYLRSTDGSNSDNGSTWLLANATLAGSAADAAAGDRIWVSQVHAESSATSVDATFPGTPSSPNQILCGNDAAEPPTAISSGATFTTTGTGYVNIAGSIYAAGSFVFNVGTGGSSGFGCTFGQNAGNVQFWKDVTVRLVGSSNSLRLYLGPDSSVNPGVMTLSNLTVKFAATGQAISLRNSKIRIDNLVAESGGTTPTTLFEGAAQRCMDAVIAGGDLSNLGAGVNLFPTGDITGGRVVMYGVKMPSSWTGDLRSGAPTVQTYRAEMHACHSADGMYYERVSDYMGKSREETVYVRSGGRTVPNSESGGTNPIPLSLKVDGTSHACKWPHMPFELELEPIWNTTVGSSVTVTVPIMFDSASDWNDNDIVLRCGYPGTTGSTKYSFADSGPSDVMASTTALNTKFGASSGWTTTSLSNAKQRQLQVTFTPRETGFILPTILLYKQSPCYVDKATAA